MTQVTRVIAAHMDNEICDYHSLQGLRSMETVGLKPPAAQRSGSNRPTPFSPSVISLLIQVTHLFPETRLSDSAHGHSDKRATATRGRGITQRRRGSWLVALVCTAGWPGWGLSACDAARGSEDEGPRGALEWCPYPAPAP